MMSLSDLMGGESSALADLFDSAGGLQLKEIENRYKLGQDTLKNNYRIAKLQSSTQRYAVDEAREYHRGLLKQAEAEMREIGIPDMLIRRYVAEKNYEIARTELDIKRETIEETRRQFNQTLQQRQYEFGQELGQRQYEFGRQLGEEQRQFNITSSGYTTMPGTLTEPEQARYNLLLARDAELQRAGQPGIGGDDLLELQRYERTLASGGGQVPTLEREQFGLQQQELGRRYALDVANLGTELSGQPDQYFQARRFLALEAPRLLGQDTSGVAFTGAPTPQIQTLGARMAGIDPATVGTPAAPPYGGSAPSGPVTGYEAPGSGTPSPGGDLTLTDDRAKQLSAIAKAAPPSPYDGLDEQDAATLRLMEAVYKRGAQATPRGELERLDASGNMPFLRSAGTLLGYSPDQFLRQYQSYAPTQGDARLG